MVHAFVFVDTATGTSGKLISLIREIEGVSEAYVVSGDFDVVAELDTERVYDVLSTVTREIRPLDGVGTTRTYITLE